MNTVDIILLVLLVFGFIRGLNRGLFVEVQLNGKRGHVLNRNPASCRYRVVVEDMQPIRFIMVKAKNLEFQIDDHLSDSDDRYEEIE